MRERSFVHHSHAHVKRQTTNSTFPPVLDTNEQILLSSFDNTSIAEWSYYYSMSHSTLNRNTTDKRQHMATMLPARTSQWLSGPPTSGPNMGLTQGWTSIVSRFPFIEHNTLPPPISRAKLTRVRRLLELPGVPLSCSDLPQWHNLHPYSQRRRTGRGSNHQLPEQHSHLPRLLFHRQRICRIRLCRQRPASRL
jgi:hypothetical protein